MKKLRFGILSTAGIARKNWPAIFSSGNCVVSAVASRDRDRSRQFIAECQARTPFENPPAALGSYEELLASKDVDAVYIPLPTGLRKEWVLRAAQAGKHVICEKPCGVSLAEVREMTGACKNHRVQFMDGVMFMHSPRLARVREFLDDNQSVGQVRRISSVFSFYGADDFFRDNIRVDGRLEPDRLPGGSRLVLPPVLTLDHELATAAHRNRPHPLAIGRRCRTCVRADGIFRRTGF